MHPPWEPYELALRRVGWTHVDRYGTAVVSVTNTDTLEKVQPIYYATVDDERSTPATYLIRTYHDPDTVAGSIDLPSTTDFAQWQQILYDDGWDIVSYPDEGSPLELTRQVEA